MLKEDKVLPTLENENCCKFDTLTYITLELYILPASDISSITADIDYVSTRSIIEDDDRTAQDDF